MTERSEVRKYGYLSPLRGDGGHRSTRRVLS